MKIAIQGHATRFKEVIDTLVNLGGINKRNFIGDDTYICYYIDKFNYIEGQFVTKEGQFVTKIDNAVYQLYTLEEFEKEFPFKIGDKVTIIGTKHPKIITGISDTQWGLRYVISEINFPDSKELPHISQISLYKEMKEERNITLTLDKAIEWYNQGGELKEIALQAFTKEELNPLPKSWKEFCKRYQVPAIIFGPCVPNKYIALWKLEQLRDCYRQGWKPDWTNGKSDKYCICVRAKGPQIILLSEIGRFLAFQSREIAEEFLENFEPLIKEAGDLI